MADTVSVQPKDVWERVCFGALQSLSDAGAPELDQDMLSATLMAAARAAREAIGMHKDFFGEINEERFEQAVLIFEVFALAMVSRFVKHLMDMERDYIHARDAVWEDLASGVIALLTGSGDERLAEARAIDTQFKYGRDPREGRQSMIPWSIEHLLLLTSAARVVDPRCSLPPLDALPSDDPYEFSQRGWVPPDGLNFTDMRRVTELHHSLLASEAGMYTAFNTLRQQRGEA